MALGPARRFSERKAAPKPVKAPVRPLFELGLSLAFCPTSPSPAAAARGASHGLLLPTALASSDGPVFCRGTFQFPTPRRPQGLVTLSATYSHLNRAGHFSDRQRSWDSPCEAFSADNVADHVSVTRTTHLPFLPGLLPPPIKATAGCPARGFWVFVARVPCVRSRV